MTEEALRGIVVYLLGGGEQTFRDATAYSFTGPNDRDLSLVDWDWENHQMRRHVAYFPAGGWIGFRWGDLPTNNAYANRVGFKLDKRETEPTQPADHRST